MPAYKVGDTVIHWTSGRGKIVAVDDKGQPGQPCLYYIIQAGEKTLWVPVEEIGITSLHLPTLDSEFGEFISILHSAGVRMSDNPLHRRIELERRMAKKNLVETCLVIRDLAYRSHLRKLSRNDIGVLNQAKLTLLDEWEVSLGISRAKAKAEMEWTLKEIPARQNTISSPKSTGQIE